MYFDDRFLYHFPLCRGGDHDHHFNSARLGQKLGSEN